MAFINDIPTSVPGLDHLVTVNNKVLKPGLGVAQTARGYVNTIKKDKKQEQVQTHRIIIDTIPRQHPANLNRGDPIDFEYTDDGQAQRQRVKELMETRPRVYTLPAQPRDADMQLVPSRPQKKSKRPINRWKIGFFGMLLAAAAAIIPLAVVGARSGADCDPAHPDQSQSADTSTQVSVKTFTETKTITSVSTTTDIRMRTETVTDCAEATGIGNALSNASN
jgi:hypothetical protein